jgi:hypothetical protein
MCSNVDKLLCKKTENSQVINELNNKKCVFDVKAKRFDEILIWAIIYEKSWKCILIGCHKKLH